MIRFRRMVSIRRDIIRQFQWAVLWNSVRPVMEFSETDLPRSSERLSIASWTFMLGKRDKDRLRFRNGRF